jgi:hypothetical protein
VKRVIENRLFERLKEGEEDTQPDNIQKQDKNVKLLKSIQKQTFGCYFKNFLRLKD